MAAVPLDGPPVTFEEHVLRATGAHPVAVGAAITVVLEASNLWLAWIFGWPVWEPDNELPLPINAGAWTAMVTSLLVGFAFVATQSAIRKHGEELAALAPAIPGRTAEELRRAWREALATSTVPRRLSAALGLLIGVGMWALTAFRLLESSDLGSVLLESCWFLVVVPLVFWELARGAFFTVLGLRVLSRQAAGIEVDVLDLSGLAPLGRLGLWNAFVWIVGSTLGSLFFLNLPATRDLIGVYPTLAAILVLAAVALIVPLGRARTAIARAKRVELERLDRAIRAERRIAPEPSEEARAAAARLGGLLAYRTAVEAVREWPVDVSILRRFALYLLIPIGGWLGGAFAERLLERLLD